MSTNPLLKIPEFGQSMWLDYLRRGMLVSGELEKLIKDDGLRGMTSNPAIFYKAIDGSNDYSSAVRSLAQEGKTETEIYEILTVDDVRQAADEFRSVYDSQDKNDGFVSLEVSPHLARNVDGTIKEARRLWSKLDRPNVFIKVPATKEGLKCIRQLISEGINVNVTLLFGLERYREVTEAYIGGLEDRLKAGESIDSVRSVASFFLSRIDVLLDPQLEKIMEKDDSKAEIARTCHGEVAIASAKVAYQMYKEIFGGDRFRKLMDKGARTQRVLWASTSTKNPSYSDVKYVEALIGPETINTVPPETLNAYRDHGNPAFRLEDDIDKAHKVLDDLKKLGIDLKKATQQLEDEGIEKFNKPYDQLMDTLKEKRKETEKETLDKEKWQLGKYKRAIEERAGSLDADKFGEKLWRKDPSPWTTDPKQQDSVVNGLGWLHVAEKMVECVPELEQFASEMRAAGYEHVVHMGMGGSSLAPLAFQRSFPVGDNGLPVLVLDTTDPQTILDIEKKVSVAKTLFIVASKSGTTAEPLTFLDYFYARVKEVKPDNPGENFVAITDPGTPLVDLAQERRFRKVFLNFKDIGGRYSALSYFGMLPAALMGLDIGEFLERAVKMAEISASSIEVEANPGLFLGATIGELARQGRDKLTFVVPDSLSTFGMWLEQLLAESTGKSGTGILPVAGEPLGEPSEYGSDRVFARMKLAHEQDEETDRALKALADAGHPVITIEMTDKLDLAQEMMRWELATATAGAVLEINAFNQPNVQESKDNTNRLLKQVEENGSLKEGEPALNDGPLQAYAATKAKDIGGLLSEFFSQAKPGDYVSLQAYVTESEQTDSLLKDVRLRLRHQLMLATTAGYGPRFLHSTGQYHKGGPNTGLFMQFTARDVNDVDVPDKRYSFSVLKHAQAQGDLEALRKHERRVIRIDLGDDVQQGLNALLQTLEAAPVNAH